MSDQTAIPFQAPSDTVPGESPFKEQLEHVRESIVAEVTDPNADDEFDTDDPIMKAKMLVVKNYNEHRDKRRAPAMLTDFVVVLWFTGNRGNFRAICEFTVVHGIRYEISYNARKREAFLDVYKKTNNTRLVDV